jgi:hypothetical protein
MRTARLRHSPKNLRRDQGSIPSGQIAIMAGHDTEGPGARGIPRCGWSTGCDEFVARGVSSSRPDGRFPPSDKSGPLRTFAAATPTSISEDNERAPGVLGNLLFSVPLACHAEPRHAILSAVIAHN